jgi:hypothetical protein
VIAGGGRWLVGPGGAAHAVRAVAMIATWALSRRSARARAAVAGRARTAPARDWRARPRSSIQPRQLEVGDQPRGLGVGPACRRSRWVAGSVAAISAVTIASLMLPVWSAAPQRPRRATTHRPAAPGRARRRGRDRATAASVIVLLRLADPLSTRGAASAAVRLVCTAPCVGAGLIAALIASWASQHLVGGGDVGVALRRIESAQPRS